MVTRGLERSQFRKRLCWPHIRRSVLVDPVGQCVVSQRGSFFCVAPLSTRSEDSVQDKQKYDPTWKDTAHVTVAEPPLTHLSILKFGFMHGSLSVFVANAFASHANSKELTEESRNPPDSVVTTKTFKHLSFGQIAFHRNESDELAELHDSLS